MIKVINNSFCFIILILIVGCSSGNYVVSEKGDTAELVRKDGYSIECELVSIQDTAIIFSSLHQNKQISSTLYYEPLINIKSIKVKGYSGSGWLAPILIFQVLPAGLLTGAALSLDSDNSAVVAVFIIPILSALLFSGSDEDSPQWNDTQPIENLQDLKKYCHYPFGLTERLLSELLNKHSQSGLVRIIRR